MTELQNDVEQLDNDQTFDTEISDIESLVAESEPVILSEEEQKTVDHEQKVAEMEAQFQTADVVAMALMPLFSLLTPNWKITNDEVGALSQSYGNLLDKYFPDGISSRFSVEIVALTTTATVFGSRIGTPIREEKQPEKEVDKNADD